ncbi:MAG TPA: hypothetical protein VEV39_05785 [Gemmatimonadales bacterium]|nr:hypothetical protein [Gemmatimonadales bacterium]
MAAPLTSSRLIQVCRLLNAAGVRYVVVGAQALAYHGYPRATKDVDILIEPTIENARKVLSALEGLTFGISRELDPADVIAKALTIVGDTPRVDLLTIAWSVRYADAAPKVERVAIDGVEIPFPDLDTLIRTKQSDRAADKADLEELEQIKKLKGKAKTPE